MSESVKVAVRCRPMSQRELQQRCKNVITIDPIGKTCTLDGTDSGKVYQFDAAFGSESSTESVYEAVGSVVVEAVLEGYNATVFAYGQTGCGKSFTMQGFIERALEHLFEATSTSSQNTRYLALLSYLEIYNEKLRDLLQDSGGENLLQLKEDPSRGTYVAGGLRETTVKNAIECGRLVEQGNRRRIAAATKMNQASSRSHAVLTLSLEAIAINDDDDDDDNKRSSAVRRGRLHLVDLAGSERQTRTGATGDRLKEAASINLSLSALGNVISALAAGNGRHVPYRFVITIYLRPGCPFRDLEAIRNTATWSEELNRWRLPNVSMVSLRIALPPPAQSRELVTNCFDIDSAMDECLLLSLFQCKT